MAVTLKLGGQETNVKTISYEKEVFYALVQAFENCDEISCRRLKKTLRNLMGRDRAIILENEAFDQAFALNH